VASVPDLDWQYGITFLLLMIQAAYVTVKRSRKIRRDSEIIEMRNTLLNGIQ